MAADTRQIWLRASPENRKKMPDLMELYARVDKENRDRVLAELGSVYTASGDLSTARKLKAELCDRQPNRLGGWLDYFDVLIQMKDWEQAKVVLDRIHLLDGPDGPHALCCEVAVRLARAGANDHKLVSERRVSCSCPNPTPSLVPGPSPGRDALRP